MDKRIIDALTAEMPRVLQWQFPVAVVEFRDEECETVAVPDAHLTDITWLDRGREYTVLVTLTEDEVHDALAEAEIAASQREIDELVAYANKHI